MIRWVVMPSLAATVMFLLLVLTCRWIWRTSRPLGIIVATGMAIRLVFGSVLFWISYLHLPILSSLQLGRGFWRMALDAPQYHDVGVFVAEGLLSSVPEEALSRTYVQVLAMWMRLVGTSPFSAVLMNLASYVATCALLVAMLRGLASRHAELVRRCALVALTASPMLLFVSTQVLKDDFFLLASAVLSSGVWWIALTLGAPTPASWRRLVPGLLAVSVGVFVTVGVRVYYPAIAGLCLAGAFMVALVGRRRVQWSVIAGCAALTLVTAGAAVTFGSEEGRRYLDVIGGASSPSEAASMVEGARAGFIASGGSTNIGEEPPESHGVAGRIRDLAMGLATMFVPLVVLRAVGLVDVSGGLAMMALGDLDTLFFDAVFVAMALLTWRLRRDVRPNAAYLAFAVGLVVMLCALMAYTVTNVGTLVRLRQMVLVPLVTMPLAFARLPWGLGGDTEPDDEAVSAAPPTRAG